MKKQLNTPLSNLIASVMVNAYRTKVFKEFRELFGDEFFEITFEGIIEHFDFNTFQDYEDKFVEIAANAVQRANKWGQCYC